MAFTEKSGAKQAAVLPEPFVRKPRPCAATLRGRVQPYVFQTRCAKGGEVLTEHNAWQAIRWEWNAEARAYERKRALLCEVCAKRARRYYEDLRGKSW